MSASLWDQNKSIEIKNNNKSIEITFKNRTPLLQIDVSNKSTLSYTKKMWEKVDGIDYPIAIPVYSANALRGTLRRIGLRLIIQIGMQNDSSYSPQIDPKTLNFYASGDDKTVESINSLTYKQQEKLREIMPLISLFGAGLSTIEGKTAVSELRPIRESFLHLDDEGKIKSEKIVKTISSVRFDETMRNSSLSALLDNESVEEWLLFLQDNKDTKKRLKVLLEKKKKNGMLEDAEEKELKNIMSFKDNQTQMISEKEYVVPNITFTSSIGEKRGMAFTDIEKGLLLASLLELSLTQLGSCKKEGFGVGDWNINYDDCSIESLANEDYFLGEKKVMINQPAQEYINTFTDFIIQNRVWEYLKVDALFSKVL